MKYKNWDDFKLHVSSIKTVLTHPLSAKPPSKYDLKKVENIISKGDITPEDQAVIDAVREKERIFLDPPLAKGTISMLTRRYPREKYKKLVLSIGRHYPAVQKGTMMEDESVVELSKFYKKEFIRNTESFENDYLRGFPDIFHAKDNMVIDTKVSWNIETFFKARLEKLSALYWYQMQGYLELTGAKSGKVCFVLLSTPKELIEKEKVKTITDFITGTINRDKYEAKMEMYNLAFDYDKIPLRRRIIEFNVKKCDEVFPKIYKRIAKCREWLNWFEREHLTNKKIITLAEDYANSAKESNTESDTADTYSGDTE